MWSRLAKYSSPISKPSLSAKSSVRILPDRERNNHYYNTLKAQWWTSADPHNDENYVMQTEHTSGLRGRSLGKTKHWIDFLLNKLKFKLCSEWVTCIDTNKWALGDVIKATNAPALILGLKELQSDLQTVLNQAVSAHLWITAAALITFIDPENANEREKERQNN